MKFKYEIEQINEMLGTPKTYFVDVEDLFNKETNIGYIGYDKTSAGYRLFMTMGKNGSIDYIGARMTEYEFKSFLEKNIKQYCKSIENRIASLKSELNIL